MLYFLESYIYYFFSVYLDSIPNSNTTAASTINSSYTPTTYVKVLRWLILVQTIWAQLQLKEV